MHLLTVCLLGIALLGIGAVSGLAAGPTIEATGSSPANYAWTPSTADVDSGESVNFKNPTGASHGLFWESGPETPDCTGTPSVGQASWSGSCTFVQGGTYKFYCPVHPSQMKGTITVSGPAAPIVSTGSASALSETGATLNGTVNPSGQATKYQFDYGTTTAYDHHVPTPEESVGEGTSAVPKAVAVSGLTPATTYHFRIVAKNATGTRVGADHTFATLGPPSATTGAATAIGDVSASLQGLVNPHGQQTTFFFKFGTTTMYGEETGEQSAGKGAAGIGVSASLSGLSPETTYHFQLIAKNVSGTTPGQDQAFTTAATPTLETSPPPPAALMPPALSVDPAAPGTKITLKPSAKTRDRTPTVKFTSTAPGATYKCSVDGKPFKPCRSPFTTPALKPGRHAIRIAAVSGGLTDPTPAICSFRVIAPRQG